MRRLLYFGFLLVHPAFPVAQARHSPAQLLTEAFRADSLGDWRGLLRIIHPVALDGLRLELIDQISQGTFGPTANPDTCFARLETLFNRRMLDSVFQVRAFEAFARLSPDTIFARARRAYAVGRDKPPWAPTERRILGSLLVSDSLAYVLVNEHLGELDSAEERKDRSRVYTARAWRGSWRLMDVDFLDLAGSFSFGAEGQCPRPSR